MCCVVCIFCCGAAPWCDILRFFFSMHDSHYFVLSAVVNHRSTWCHDFSLHFFSLFVGCAFAIRLHTSTSTLHLRFLHFTIDMYIIFMVNCFEMNFSPVDKWRCNQKQPLLAAYCQWDQFKSRLTQLLHSNSLDKGVCVCVHVCKKLNFLFFH